MISINRKASELAERFCTQPEAYRVIAEKTATGATIIDAGVKAPGGLEAGLLTTEICMGGLGNVQLTPKPYGDIELLSVFVSTDHPATATLGSQFAGWQIKKDDFFAIGSGPARALALKPRDIYEKIQYKDTADVAVLVLETAKHPPPSLIQDFCTECQVEPANLTIILTPTTSIAGSIQISGRIVETGIHKLHKLGIDPRTLRQGWGTAPIAPPHPKFSEAMGKTNDVILYGGTAAYTIDYEDDEQLNSLLLKAPSSSSAQYGRPFKEIFKEAHYDFYQIDPNLFAPAELIVNNIRTGSIFHVGETNVPVLKRALNLN
ncbi:MAG: methenyltetrahydromethanopterin cyclohydrolase [Candidatus Bathyarchaeota archaeon]|nr:MAG: methenyltetrahydromethanopterin cyclohydrolase [Candidatus Bathyarchaeota archaeon]